MDPYSTERCYTNGPRWNGRHDGTPWDLHVLSGKRKRSENYSFIGCDVHSVATDGGAEWVVKLFYLRVYDVLPDVGVDIVQLASGDSRMLVWQVEGE